MITDSLEIGTTSATRIYWYDETKTILIHDALKHWAWEDAYESLSIVNQTIRAHEKPMYTIHWLHPASAAMPKGSSLANLRRLMMEDPPNEQLVIILGASMMVETFIKTISKAYKMMGLLPKYRYVKTLPDALAIIEEHRQRASLLYKSE